MPNAVKTRQQWCRLGFGAIRFTGSARTGRTPGADGIKRKVASRTDYTPRRPSCPMSFDAVHEPSYCRHAQRITGVAVSIFDSRAHTRPICPVSRSTFDRSADEAHIATAHVQDNRDSIHIPPPRRRKLSEDHATGACLRTRDSADCGERSVRRERPWCRDSCNAGQRPPKPLRRMGMRAWLCTRGRRVHAHFDSAARVSRP